MQKATKEQFLYKLGNPTVTQGQPQVLSVPVMTDDDIANFLESIKQEDH